VPSIDIVPLTFVANRPRASSTRTVMNTVVLPALSTRASKVKGGIAGRRNSLVSVAVAGTDPGDTAVVATKPKHWSAQATTKPPCTAPLGFSGHTESGRTIVTDPSSAAVHFNCNARDTACASTQVIQSWVAPPYGGAMSSVRGRSTA
jgi:hypothetical protein